MATREELEAQIAAAPTDDNAYSVYADFLQLHGDPRGELIALDIAGEAARHDRATWRRRRAELIARHPELAPPEVDNVELVWRCGFVRRAIIRTRASLADLFGHPALAFLSEIVAPGTSQLSEDRLAEVASLAPCLRWFAIGDPTESRHWSNIPGSPIRVARLPLDRLEHLYASPPVTFDAAPRLRSLELAGVDVERLRMLEKAKLPALERLVLHLEARVELALDDLRPLFVDPPPRLRELEIPDLPIGDALVPLLVTSPLLRQLRVLRLWNAGLGIAGVREITPEAFGHLEILDLSDPGLDDESVRLLERVGPDVRTISPRIREILRRPR